MGSFKFYLHVHAMWVLFLQKSLPFGQTLSNHMFNKQEKVVGAVLGSCYNGLFLAIFYHVTENTIYFDFKTICQKCEQES